MNEYYGKMNKNYVQQRKYKIIAVQKKIDRHIAYIDNKLGRIQSIMSCEQDMKK